MTRALVYASSLVLLGIASALTLTAIILPRWVSFHDTDVLGAPLSVSYGLHQRCTATPLRSCTRFPTYQDCHGSADKHYFCGMWRTVGFLMSFAVVVEAVVGLAVGTVLVGGRKARETGWRLVCGLLMVAAAVQCVAMTMVAYLYDLDERFFVGWRLDAGWVLTTVSWVLEVMVAAGLAVSAVVLLPEGGYELIK